MLRHRLPPGNDRKCRGINADGVFESTTRLSQVQSDDALKTRLQATGLTVK